MYRAMLFCQHANENPNKLCDCPSYCGCREIYQGICYSNKPITMTEYIMARDREVIKAKYLLSDAEQNVIKAAENYTNLVKVPANQSPLGVYPHWVAQDEALGELIKAIEEYNAIKNQK